MQVYFENGNNSFSPYDYIPHYCTGPPICNILTEQKQVPLINLYGFIYARNDSIFAVRMYEV